MAAQSISYDMPEGAKHVTSRLEQSHQIVKFTPDDDESLAYQIVLPKEWIVERELDEGSDTFPQWRLIGLFAPAVDPLAPFVSVSVTNLPFEVNLEDWVEFFCGMDGWQVFASRWWETPSGLVLDAGAVKGTEAARDVMRVMAVADKGRIFMTSGVAQASQWDRWKDHFLIACATFELVQPTGDPTLEPLDSWEGGPKGCSFGVAHPATWESQPQQDVPDGKMAVELALVTSNDLLAYIMIKATALDNHSAHLDKLVQQAQAELDASEFDVLGEQLFIPSPANAGKKIKLPEGFTIGPASMDALSEKIDGYQGTVILTVQTSDAGDRELEARLGFKVVKGMAFSVYLLSIRREKNFLLWMRSKRAFEIVREFTWKRGHKPQLSRARAVTRRPPGKGVTVDAGWRMLGYGRHGGGGFKSGSVYGTRIATACMFPDPHRAPDWLPDNQAKHCFACQQEFTLFRRRHHCRNCALIFCDADSSKRIDLPRFGMTKPVRVCDGCYAVLHHTRSAAKPSMRRTVDPMMHVWCRFEPDAVVKYKTVWDNDIKREETVTKRLVSIKHHGNRSPVSYLLEVIRKSPDGKKDIKSKLTLDFWDGYLLAETDGEKVDEDTLLVDGEEILCDKYSTKSHVNGLDIERIQWVTEESPFPMRTVIRNQNGSYLEANIVHQNELIHVQQDDLSTSRLDGQFSTSIGSCEFRVWLSLEVPGGFVMSEVKTPTGSITTSVVDYNGSV